jgi:hypothetical protein
MGSHPDITLKQKTGDNCKVVASSHALAHKIKQKIAYFEYFQQPQTANIRCDAFNQLAVGSLNIYQVSHKAVKGMKSWWFI